MLKVIPSEIPVPKLHGYLLAAIGPRPIALASTINKNGQRNLSPFSFFNVFSANPPIAIFSPARRGKNNTTKHTYENAKEVPEVVINIVNYDLVQQTSLSSTEYAEGVDEFVKSGLTAVESEIVKPARVKESPVQFECKINDVVELGKEGGAGNLIISEIVMIHIDEDILDADGRIDQNKIDLVGRMGANWYTRANNGLFEVEKPLSTLGIGVDNIPEHVRLSDVLTGNDLGMLGNVEELPDHNDIVTYKNENLSSFFENANPQEIKKTLHEKARIILLDGKVEEAWKILLADSI